MLKREDVLSIGYLKKTSFRGSYQGMRFLMQKEEADDKNILKVFAWPEPYSFDKTDEDRKISCEQEFSEEGIVQAVAWLNEVHAQVCLLSRA